ncbi:hypothetical protein [Algoriphagus hitonicola]|uniref:Uncharacterized protein n=1 Tax=Algoriphagus hitonicola TaxID=435880 RepID=A0A1I2XPK8_9BACT|nr:hypothetical protein [Algoriphagus hitonicola]SFH15424.1 hypothetical protein SAMN04487988_12131 [Algoriphagus hitonicola]
MRRNKIILGVSLFIFCILPILESSALGSRKKVSCVTVDYEGNVLSEGRRCDWGWNDCLSNPCPNPDGTIVEWEDQTFGD